MRTRLPLAFIAALWLVRILVACECHTRTQPEAFDHAGAVFYGKLVKVSHLFPDRAGAENDAVEYTFKLIETWKGPRSSVILVRGVEQQSMCDDYSLKQGNSYLLYVYPPSTPWAKAPTATYQMGLCGLRWVLDDERKISEERKILGPGVRPSESRAK